MLPSFCNDTVIRIRPGTKESRGSIIPDWTQAQKKEVNGCSMQPASTSLSEDGRVMAITDRYTLFAPTSADIKAGDRIEFEGLIYEIDGEVRIRPTAFNLDHKPINLKRFKG